MIIAKLQYGLSVSFVGLATVFVGLIILIGLIKLMEKAMGRLSAKPTADAAPAAAEATAQPQADDGELIAVIAAAIAAAMEAEAAEMPSEEEPKGFVVRSIRRINNAPAWNRAGREEQIYSRM